jgi:MtfA peptidase
MNQPLPDAWLEIVKRNVPYYRCLPNEKQQELQGLIQVFLAEKWFEGCGGLQVTDEIRLTIAAQACVLLLGRQTEFYPTLRSILVYPHSYVAHVVQPLPDGTILEGEQVRLGESWSFGNLVLSWDDVVQGASDIRDGHNVVFHEFAHQLDNESGAAEGAPLLPRRSMYIAWARVLGKEYRSLLENIEHHRATFIDEYGATNPAEFFAVVTEFFFEKPRQLKARHPDLYEQFRLFYQQDPAEWRNGPCGDDAGA